MADLIPNRECGKCTVCCKVLTIDHTDLQKLPGTMCQHCKNGTGCKIYDTRPQPCQDFFCGWRTLRDMDDKWRPDKSGIMVRFQREHVPQGYQPVGFQFLIFGRTDVITPAFINYVTVLVERRIPVFLALRGPEGFSDVLAFMNRQLEQAVAARDRNGLVKILRANLDGMTKNKFEPAVLKHGPSSVPV